jgi:hypothetical protein
MTTCDSHFSSCQKISQFGHVSYEFICNFITIYLFFLITSFFIIHAIIILYFNQD